MRPPCRLRSLALALVLGLAPAGLAAEGQPEIEPAAIEAEKAARDRELQDIRRDLAITDERLSEIAAEIATLEKDRARLNSALLEAAGTVQDLEARQSQSETALARLADEETLIRESLAGRQEVLAEVLAAAQRIGRRPPPALVVRPEDALGAVRSAIVLGAVLPEIRVEAESLSADLAALVSVRERAVQEKATLEADAARMRDEEARLRLLVEEKRNLGERRSEDLVAEQDRAKDLAERARSLGELIITLDRDLVAARAERAAAAEAARLQRPSPTDDGRLQPALGFADAQGKLALPVRGVTLAGFGDNDGFGGHAAGMTIATRSGARVTSPMDGWVVYAGPFRSYGQLLILDAGDGYHVVLAGMDAIDVEPRQFVLAGEPVGSMGSRRLDGATAPGAGGTQPVLYVEFRKDGTSIDPAPWWAETQDRKARG